MAAGGREREDAGRDQGAAGGHVSKPEPGAARGGAHHVLRPASVLQPRSRHLPDRADDAHHAADAARLPARLRAPASAQHQLEGAAQLVHADRQGGCWVLRPPHGGVEPERGVGRGLVGADRRGGSPAPHVGAWRRSEGKEGVWSGQIAEVGPPHPAWGRGARERGRRGSSWGRSPRWVPRTPRGVVEPERGVGGLIGGRSPRWVPRTPRVGVEPERGVGGGLVGADR